jgi:hypothetical protein
MISLIVCTATLTFLGGVAVGNPSMPAADSPHNDLNGGGFAYQRDIGPSAENTSLINTWANRTIVAGDYGLITVTDTFMIRNNGSLMVPSWTFYLPSDVYPKLRYIAASGNLTGLDVVGAPNFESFVGMRVDFTRIGGLSAGSSVLVKLIQQYAGLVKPNPTTGSREVKLFFYWFLTSPYLTRNYSAFIRLPTGAATIMRTNVTGQVVTPFNCSRLGATAEGSYAYTLSGMTLVEVDVERTVEIDAYGYFSVTEIHHVKNIGPVTISGIHFLLPMSTIPGSLEARDSSGELPSAETGKTVSVGLRYGLEINGTIVFYVSYRAYVDSYRAFENGLYFIRMLPVTVYNASVGLEKMSVIFPSHSQLHSATHSPDEIRAVGDQTIVSYSFEEVTPLSVGPIELSYSEEVGEAFQRPIFFALGIFLIGFFYIGVRKIVPRAGPTGAVKEAEEKVRGLTAIVKEFCANYEEKTALTLELEKLAEDRRKGRVSKRAFMERLQLARRRIATLTNSINEAKKKLIPGSKRYAAFIKQIDTYEEERENAGASLENLELRRRQGKVSGDVYNRLKYDNTKKVEKATAGIDSIIVQFRQEAM